MKENHFSMSPRVLIAAFIFTFIALLAPSTTYAQGPYGGSGAFMYTVQYGDTMSSIANRFGVPMQAIMQANPQYGAYMSVGQQMYVPNPYSPGNYSYGATSRYIVQPGDTLFGIARRFGVSVYALMSINRIYNPNFIFAGMSLLIPGGYVPPSPYGNYIVRSGDTLFRIALRFGTSVYALMIANHIPNPNLIFAGMRLVIPSGQPYPAPPPPAPGPTRTPASGTVNISMQNTAYNPQSITVKAGTMVIWRNAETNGMQHTVTSGSPNAPSGMFDSGTLNPGQTFQFTFSTPGTFAYYCRIHGAAMTGIVIVTQ